MISLAPNIDLLTPAPLGGYSIIDSGDGEKLEQVGAYRLIRPEPQAMWPKSQPDAIWQSADAIFTAGGRDDDDEGRGQWQTVGKRPLPEAWVVPLMNLQTEARLTRFRHIGFFPEQGALWAWLEAEIPVFIDRHQRQPRVLNLFGYTGVASLIAAQAGAHVTHVDASPKAVAWGKINQTTAGLGDKPIRWLVDDALDFVLREGRRAKTYDFILLDPPKYGRGPNGEIWDLRRDLGELLTALPPLMAAEAHGVVLTAYAERLSAITLCEALRAHLTMGGIKGGTITAGEYALCDGAQRLLPTAMMARWQA